MLWQDLVESADALCTTIGSLDFNKLPICALIKDPDSWLTSGKLHEGITHAHSLYTPVVQKDVRE